jgi:glutamine amidotransferase
MKSIGLIDYGAGNFTSVLNALRRLGVKVLRIDRCEQLLSASHIILPGVGSFPSAMQNLCRTGMVAAIKDIIDNDRRPFLGICVGMQLLATEGTEFRRCDGLGVIKGTVEKIPVEEKGLRLPHIGWNEVELSSDSVLFHGLSDNPIFYFVHSFHLNAADRNDIIAYCDYGSGVVAAVCKRRTYGVQFHPEKSQQDGLKLLNNFVSIAS